MNRATAPVSETFYDFHRGRRLNEGKTWSTSLYAGKRDLLVGNTYIEDMSVWRVLLLKGAEVSFGKVREPLRPMILLHVNLSLVEPLPGVSSRTSLPKPSPHVYSIALAYSCGLYTTCYFALCGLFVKFLLYRCQLLHVILH